MYENLMFTSNRPYIYGISGVYSPYIWPYIVRIYMAIFYPFFVFGRVLAIFGPCMAPGGPYMALVFREHARLFPALAGFVAVLSQNGRI